MKEGTCFLRHNMTVLLSVAKMFDLQITDHIADFFIISEFHWGMKGDAKILKKIVIWFNIKVNPVIDKIALHMPVILGGVFLVQKVSVCR